MVEDVKDFWAFSKAGRQLADLHLNYETVPAYKGAIVLFNQIPKKEIEKGLGGKELEDINLPSGKNEIPKQKPKRHDNLQQSELRFQKSLKKPTNML